MMSATVENKEITYCDPDSNKHWSIVLSDPMYARRVLPWERTKIPTVLKNGSTLDALRTHQTMKRLLQRGRWWFLSMGTVRAWRSVWSSTLGKVVIVALMFTGYEINAWYYLQAQQYKADTVRADVFSMKDDTYRTLIWPWGIADRVDDVVERHDRQVHLHYLAQTMAWNIPKYDWERSYSKRNLLVNRSGSDSMFYFSNEELSRLEEQMRQSLLLRDMVNDMTERALQIGWEIQEQGPYLEKDRLEKLYESVQESERLHPIALDLIERGEKIDWDVLKVIEHYPYNEDNLRLISQQMKDSERLHQTMLELVRRGNCSRWASNIQSLVVPPYSDTNRATLEKHIENDTACYRPPPRTSSNSSSRSYDEPGLIDQAWEYVKDAAEAVWNAIWD